jgi:hypothetical protein
MPFPRQTTALDGYSGLTAYAGDLHNHCDISYGHGSIEDAYRNARLQLDFATVTGHASWHDMPSRPEHISEYHRRGFERLRGRWSDVQSITEGMNVDGEFASFLSFEWHSMTYGDHCVYYRSGTGPLEPSQSQTLEELRTQLRALGQRGLAAMALPHHIGYLRGFRGINWSTYTDEFAPVIELVSMHGNGEDDHGPRPYLHTMGPRDFGSMAYRGLEAGHRFGFIGSTDHHSAHPGSYGYGRAMVWSDALTRDSIWDAIQRRRTYCVTGDRIMLATAVNGVGMGGVSTSSGARRIDVSVRGGSSLDYVEIIRNGTVIHRSRVSAAPRRSEFTGIVALAVGWGEVGVPQLWDIDIAVEGGRIDAVEPRLHGYDIVAPTDDEPDAYSFSDWQQTDSAHVRLSTRTMGNPTVMTDATQRLALHLTGDANTTVCARINGQEVRHTIGELLQGPRVGFTGGFVSPSFVFERAEPSESLAIDVSIVDETGTGPGDWYYARVRQHNEQYAWSSPTWVEG